jgi:hypothetical protein
MSADVLKSIKNGTALFDTGINKTYSQGELQALFASQIVNSGAFLDSPEQKRLYNVFDGNNTIKAKKPIDKPAFTPAKICKYENVMVYTDFPKGASHSDTTYMWEDGTYDDMWKSVQKQNDEVPGIFPINAPLRQTVMNLAEMTGGRIEESIYKYKQGLTAEREQILREQLAEGGATAEDIDRIIALQKSEEESVKRGNPGSYLIGKAREEYTKLRAGTLKEVERSERLWLRNISDRQAIKLIMGSNPEMRLENVLGVLARANHNSIEAQLQLNTWIRYAYDKMKGRIAIGEGRESGISYEDLNSQPRRKGLRPKGGMVSTVNGGPTAPNTFYTPRGSEASSVASSSELGSLMRTFGTGRMRTQSMPMPPMGSVASTAMGRMSTADMLNARLNAM